MSIRKQITEYNRIEEEKNLPDNNVFIYSKKIKINERKIKNNINYKSIMKSIQNDIKDVLLSKFLDKIILQNKEINNLKIECNKFKKKSIDLLKKLICIEESKKYNNINDNFISLSRNNSILFNSNFTKKKLKRSFQKNYKVNSSKTRSNSNNKKYNNKNENFSYLNNGNNIKIKYIKNNNNNNNNFNINNLDVENYYSISSFTTPSRSNNDHVINHYNNTNNNNSNNNNNNNNNYNNNNNNNNSNSNNSNNKIIFSPKTVNYINDDNFYNNTVPNNNTNCNSIQNTPNTYNSNNSNTKIIINKNKFNSPCVYSKHLNINIEEFNSSNNTDKKITINNINNNYTMHNLNSNNNNNFKSKHIKNY